MAEGPSAAPPDLPPHGMPGAWPNHPHSAYSLPPAAYYPYPPPGQLQPPYLPQPQGAGNMTTDTDAGQPNQPPQPLHMYGYPPGYPPPHMMPPWPHAGPEDSGEPGSHMANTDHPLQHPYYMPFPYPYPHAPASHPPVPQATLQPALQHVPDPAPSGAAELPAHDPALQLQPQLQLQPSASGQANAVQVCQAGASRSGAVSHMSQDPGPGPVLNDDHNHGHAAATSKLSTGHVQPGSHGSGSQAKSARQAKSAKSGGCAKVAVDPEAKVTVDMCPYDEVSKRAAQASGAGCMFRATLQ